MSMEPAGVHDKLDRTMALMERQHRVVMERLAAIEARLDRREMDEEPQWAATCGCDDAGYAHSDDGPKDTLSDAYRPNFGGGGQEVYDEDTQSVFKRTWDPVAGRWVYEPEP